jgi:hypothetical protein
MTLSEHDTFALGGPSLESDKCLEQNVLYLVDSLYRMLKYGCAILARR